MPRPIRRYMPGNWELLLPIGWHLVWTWRRGPLGVSLNANLTRRQEPA